MKSIIALTDFEIIRPQIEMPQADTLNLVSETHASQLPADDKLAASLPTLVKRFGVKPEQISNRGFENLELGVEGRTILERTKFFGERATETMMRFYPLGEIAPGHIIHVTCTGYVSPSPAQSLVNDRNWSEQTDVTHAYHMGCYAALPAIRMAEGFVAAKKQTVDIVHTEMCGLHMDRLENSPEQLVVQTLFADGNVKYSARPVSEAKTGFRLLSIKEKIVRDSLIDMSWITGTHNMQMTLSRDVPTKIGSQLREFVKDLLQSSGLNLSTILKTAIFAVHPGGPKIIDAVKQTLELSEEQISTSREILFRYGNMSSATLPHVWQKLLADGIKSGTPVISLAFGPGLTIFGAIFETI